MLGFKLYSLVKGYWALWVPDSPNRQPYRSLGRPSDIVELWARKENALRQVLDPALVESWFRNFGSSIQGSRFGIRIQAFRD